MVTKYICPRDSETAFGVTQDLLGDVHALVSVPAVREHSIVTVT